MEKRSVSKSDRLRVKSNTANKMATNVHYERLSDRFLDSQFELPKAEIPYKSITLALTLFSLGGALIVVGALLLTEFIDSKYSDRTWPLLLLGSLMFIPGLYYVRIIYCAYKGYNGYTFDDVPEFD